MAADALVMHGAREHTLKDITVRLPRNKLICITGLAGSGKSSLACDTIYAEGQRRYVESLSAYARQFLQMMEKPDVDSIDGLSPAISIDQKTTSRNPRSTVGTVTEIYDYLRLLWARIGKPHCPECGEPIEGQSVEQITDRVMTLDEGTRFMVMAPVVRGRKGEVGREGGGGKGGQGRGRAAARRQRAPHLQRALRLPQLRHVHSGARAAHLLLQLAARRLRALPRARLPARGRPGAGRPGSDSL